MRPQGARDARASSLSLLHFRARRQAARARAGSGTRGRAFAAAAAMGETHHRAALPVPAAAPRRRVGRGGGATGRAARVMLPLACIALQLCVSSALIMLNKYLLSADGFHFPMILSVAGMVFSSMGTFVACRVLGLVSAPRVSWRTYMRKFVPVGALMAATLSLGNIAYLHLSVSMIQILKSLCPVITLIILHLSGIETPSRAVVLAVLVISVGCAIAVEGDIEFSWLGFWIVIASEVCECSRVVCVQWLIEGKKLKKGQKDGASAPTTSAAVSGTDPALRLNALSSLYFLAPACVLWVAVLVVTTGEGAACGRERCWEKVLARPGLYLLAASLGFGVNLTTFLVIQTSPSGSLTFKAAGTVKNAFLVYASVLAFGNVVTPLEGMGYAIAISGFVAYQRIKLSESRLQAHEHGT